MMKKSAVAVWTIVFALAAVAGCARVRTYTVEKDRVDQNLVSGNAGYLAGAPKEGDLQKDRKMTRRTYVAEVEIGRTGVPKVKGKKPAFEKCPISTEGEEGMMQEAEVAEIGMVSDGAAKEPVVYTVMPNDTLQKISQKFYGTSKRWKVIYDANKDVLKSPDKIYTGQVINIPQE
ncbi:MAG: LysM peptidoglycan-binding domain-containing protein [Candidatus Omnitrophica bacterium]|nr:LysM peptidoglycan-binding domain-containing protein [Candidatus Omnitrophota bacterium]